MRPGPIYFRVGAWQQAHALNGRAARLGARPGHRNPPRITINCQIPAARIRALVETVESLEIANEVAGVKAFSSSGARSAGVALHEPQALSRRALISWSDVCFGLLGPHGSLRHESVQSSLERARENARVTFGWCRG